MGIPGLFAYICKNFPGVVSTFTQGQLERHQKGIDHLYLDTNALIHPAAQIVFNYGERKRKPDPNGNLTQEEKLELLKKKVCDLIFYLVRLLAPTKSVMIAVDGVAPFAKQTQQRQRRYVSAKNRKEGDFDSNMISPGTSFMFSLHLALLQVSKELSAKGLKVCYSSYMTPGEGEHKLLDKIRESVPERNEAREYVESMKRKKGDFQENPQDGMHGPQDGDGGMHCIVGPDGDLLVLTLTLPMERVMIARQDMIDSTTWHLVNVENLRNSLYEKSGSSLERNQYLEDFLFVCSIFGNDFLPRIEMFTSLSCGLEYVLERWSHISEESNLSSFSLLPSLFKDLAQSEAHFLDKKFQRQLEKEKLGTSSERSSSPSPQVFDMINYRKKHYRKVFGEKEIDIDAMSRDYIRTLLWVRQYYISGIEGSEFTLWTWRYPYFYAPLMEDLSRYMMRNFLPLPPVDPLEYSPPRPILQLLYILPPKSSNLLPVGFRKIFEDEKNFPTTFEIDMEGKEYDHEAIVKIEMPDVKETEKKYLYIVNSLSRPYPRNGCTKAFEF